MHKRMIPALIACFFGAALAAACDPETLSKPPVDIVPTFGSADDVAAPGACSEAESEQACKSAVTCAWSGERCVPREVAAAL